MKSFIKYVLILIIKTCLKLLWIFPVKNNRILFFSFAGKQYSCNPKYLTEYILKHKPEKYELIWAFDKPEKFFFLKKKKIKLVKYKSFDFFMCAITSGIIIENNVAPTYIPFRKKKQFILSTWHGGGAYKKVALDQINNFSQRKIIKLASEAVTRMITSCQKFSEAFNQAYLIPYDKFLPCGMPRNDILINKNRPNLFKKVKEYFDISADTKILLYAPTFRSQAGSVEENFHAGDYSIDIDRLRHSLSTRFGGKWIVMYRAHYYLSNNTNKISIIDATDYPDMQELLYVADVLITDYSSSMWDFSFTYKPCFLFATDLDQYDSERGFYTPIKSWPFPLAQNNDELEKVILDFDEVKYKKEVQRHHMELGAYEKGTACESVCNLLFSLK